jgi:hypothetical protein
MTLADLARFVAAEPDFDSKWRLVVEFLKEYHQEPTGVRPGCLKMRRARPVMSAGMCCSPDLRSILPCGMAGRLVVAAAATGGDAYAALAPPFEPPDASAELLLHHRLAVLCYHRADAHAAAWQAAGHTVDTIRDLAAGPERERIEAETNRGAGRPYATLAAAERSRLVSGLTVLPGKP